MHSVVCIKQVPDTTEVRIDPVTNTLVRAGVPSISNPYDMHALEAAVQLKQKYGDKVTAISMGPPQASAVLREALSFGADAGILLSDRAFAGADTLATSYALTSAIEKIKQSEAVDLIFCGKQAIDGDTAQVGPGIATRLGIPLITYVIGIDEIKGNSITLERKLEEGREILLTTLPALLTVIKEANELHYPSMPDKLRSIKTEIKVWGKKDLPVDEKKLGLDGSPTTVNKVFPPPCRLTGTMIEGTDEAEKTSKLLDALKGAIVKENG